MAGWAAAAQLVGGAISAQGVYAQGMGTAKLNDLNADIAGSKRKDAKLRGRLDVQRINEQLAGILGAQTVGYAGQGVMLDSGSPLDVAEDTARLSALDSLTALNNAAREAFGFRVEEISDSYQARLARYAAPRQAIGALLGGIGQAAGSK